MSWSWNKKKLKKTLKESIKGPKQKESFLDLWKIKNENRKKMFELYI